MNLDNNIFVYRYISLPQFMYMVQNSVLTLSHMENWDDPWEKAINQVDYTIEGREKFRPTRTPFDDTFAACFTSLEESDALWRIYSSNNQGIKITTTAQELKNIMNENNKFIFQHKLDYIKYIDFKKRDEFIKAIATIDCVFYKRLAFEHEKEIRIAALINFTEIEERKEKNKRYVDLKIDINNFIKKVDLDPRATQTFEDIISKYCEHYGLIASVQKSNLYDDIDNPLNLTKQL